MSDLEVLALLTFVFSAGLVMGGILVGAVVAVALSK